MSNTVSNFKVAEVCVSLHVKSSRAWERSAYSLHIAPMKPLLRQTGRLLTYAAVKSDAPVVTSSRSGGEKAWLHASRQRWPARTKRKYGRRGGGSGWREEGRRGRGTTQDEGSVRVEDADFGVALEGPSKIELRDGDDVDGEGEKGEGDHAPEAAVAAGSEAVKQEGGELSVEAEGDEGEGEEEEVRRSKNVRIYYMQ